MITTKRNIDFFRDKVTFQYQQGTTDGMGGNSVQWMDLVSDFVMIQPISGNQRMHLEAVQSTITHKIRARYRSDLDLLGYAKKKYANEWRIKHGDRFFNIHYVLDENERMAFFEMAAAEL